MHLLEGVLVFTFIWAGPAALLSTWFMTKVTKGNALEWFLGSLTVTTGFIFAVIGAIKLSSKLHSDTIVPIILFVYFPLAGILWDGIDRLRGHESTRTQTLAKLCIPLLAAAIVGAGEILGAIMFSFPFVLFGVLTLVTPGIFWLIVRLTLKKALGVPLEEDIGFELLLTAAGVISAKLAYLLLFTIYRGLLTLPETGNPLTISIVPYLVIGVTDGIFNLKLRGGNTEISLTKRVILVTVSLYLSIALMGYTLLVWEMASAGV